MNGTTRANESYPDYRAKVIESFQDFYTTGRDRWTASETAEQVTAFAVAAVGEGAGAGRQRRVLDVGCGRGHQAARFAELLDAEVTGVDLLAVADPPPPPRGSVRFVVQDFLSYEADPFDLVVDNGCLHHQQPGDWAGWVAHGADLVRDDGVWVVSSFLSPTGEVSFHPQPNGRQNVWFTSEAVIDLFAAGGLRFRDELVIDRRFHYQGHDLHYLVQSFGRD
jgi:cyclopropane fatty-acyl-phospholipid synthase-like methyltransferase